MNLKRKFEKRSDESYFDGMPISEDAERMSFFSVRKEETENEDCYYDAGLARNLSEKKYFSKPFSERISGNLASKPIVKKEVKSNEDASDLEIKKAFRQTEIFLQDAVPRLVHVPLEKKPATSFVKTFSRRRATRSQKTRFFSDGVAMQKKLPVFVPGKEVKNKQEEPVLMDVAERETHLPETHAEAKSFFQEENVPVRVGLNAPYFSEERMTNSEREEKPFFQEYIPQTFEDRQGKMPAVFASEGVSLFSDETSGEIVESVPDSFEEPSVFVPEAVGGREGAVEENRSIFEEEGNLWKDSFFPVSDAQEIPLFSEENIRLKRYKNKKKKRKKEEELGSASWEGKKKFFFLRWGRNIRDGFCKLVERKKFEKEQEVSGVFPKPAYAFIFLGGAFLLGIGAVSYIVHGISLQGSVLGVSALGMRNVSDAVGDLKNQEFSASSEKFEQAADSFQEASDKVSSWAGVLSEVSSSLPFFSKLSSGKNALEAGKHLSLAGKYMAQLVQVASRATDSAKEKVSLLDLFRSGLELSDRARSELAQAQENLNSVKVSDLPQEKRKDFLTLKSTLPTVVSGLNAVHENAPAFIDVLGGNGPRKYLFLFQNNQEARATGGFIGSYGLLDIKDGEIRKFFINGIFDPDGQLKENIVPPQPIRKVSAAWSLHDSNWFADFPTSAEKAISFYEKTGGPTVDGVITVTPTVLQRILKETGPVALPAYDTTVTDENVISVLQYKVEEDYDKQENKPKKILSDLAPILFDRVFQAKDPNTVLGVVNALHTSLREKDILLYARNDALEGMYREMGWSGELRETQRDFVSVVNSNINGFKTDGVIEQEVKHRAEIQADGSVIDTVTVTRKHTGGDTPYEWWNAVNADYMRVYVPKGSQLISAQGQTRETVKDPLDYDALGFSRDALVSMVERSMQIDPDSGTQVFEESGKTVFGNWVYVSPKESVTIEYTYRLPFKVTLSDDSDTMLYSLLAQKQSGAIPGKFAFAMQYPKEWKTAWSSPEQKNSSASSVYDGPFATDVFFGYVFEKK